MPGQRRGDRRLRQIALGELGFRIEQLVGIGQTHAGDRVLVVRRASLRVRARLRDRFACDFAVLCGDDALAHNFLGRLVFAKTPERWMAQRSIVGPFGERHFGDERRLHPVCSTRFGATWRVMKRRLLLNERKQRAMDGGERRRIETGPDLAGVCQSTIGLIDTQQQCAEAFARPFGVGESANHHLLALLTFGFLPRGAATRLVWEVGAFGHHAFEAQIAYFFEERTAWRSKMLAIAECCRGC